MHQHIEVAVATKTAVIHRVHIVESAAVVEVNLSVSDISLSEILNTVEQNNPDTDFKRVKFLLGRFQPLLFGFLLFVSFSLRLVLFRSLSLQHPLDEVVDELDNGGGRCSRQKVVPYLQVRPPFRKTAKETLT